MAVTYESSNSSSSTDASLVITKPTGLAVGDVMLAGIEFNDDNSGSGGVDTPAGWTLLATLSTGAPAHVVTAYFQKVADSADVAASNFTFTRSGADTAYHMIGHLLRISGFGSLVGSTSNSNVALGSTTITATTFTPTKADTLFVAFLLNSSASLIGNTSIALTTDNPSWTERNETQVNDASRDSTFSFYTASRSAVTATGTITGTFDSSVASDAHMIVFAFSPQVNGSVTPTTYANGYAFNPINPSAQADAVVDTPTLDSHGSPAVWTNADKPSTTWTNPDK